MSPHLPVVLVVGSLHHDIMVEADHLPRVDETAVGTRWYPKFGGKGFHGDHVHAAVLAAGEIESGCTVHEVEDVYDTGDALVQKRVPVLAGDTVRSLAERVFAAECEAYPEGIELWRDRQAAGPD